MRRTAARCCSVVAFTSASFAGLLGVPGVQTFHDALLAGAGVLDLFEVSLLSPAQLDALQGDSFLLASLDFEAVLEIFNKRQVELIVSDVGLIRSPQDYKTVSYMAGQFAAAEKSRHAERMRASHARRPAESPRARGYPPYGFRWQGRAGGRGLRAHARDLRGLGDRPGAHDRRLPPDAGQLAQRQPVEGEELAQAPEPRVDGPVHLVAGQVDEGAREAGLQLLEAQPLLQGLLGVPALDDQRGQVRIGPRLLDGDRRLVGEQAEDIQVFAGEARRAFLVEQLEHADDLVVVDQGDAEYRLGRVADQLRDIGGVPGVEAGVGHRGREDGDAVDGVAGGDDADRAHQAAGGFEADDAVGGGGDAARPGRVGA